MTQLDNDTICAIVTPSGRSGVGIIRVSGSAALKVAKVILGFEPQPRHAHYCDFKNADSSLIDQGIALYFPNPHSFTGEDVLELQGHGGTQVMNNLLQQVVSLGPRLARPGEFSERAFLNNKIDLLQAEAIADLIDANSRQAANSALRTLQGEFSRRIHELVEQLTLIRVNVEAAIDFSDEDIDIISDTCVDASLQQARQQLRSIFDKAQQGALLKEGINVVIAGKPNAGKSSLLNSLAGLDAAIVTDIPGTTRDLLSQEISIDGLPVHVIDTAGLRTSEDTVEQEGIRRARNAITQADQILLVVEYDSYLTDEITGKKIDDNKGGKSEGIVDSLLEPLRENVQQGDDLVSILQRTTIILNKVDLDPALSPGKVSTSYHDIPLTIIRLSAKLQDGLALLSDHLKDCVGFQASEEGVFVARDRHLQALRLAEISLQSAHEGVSKHLQLELVAEDLRLAQRALGSITGEVTSDDLLGEIFSSFCVGK